MGVCKPLMPDVVAPKPHQNNHSYVSSADLPLDSLRKNLAWWAVTRRTLKNHKTVKIGGWALAWVNTAISNFPNQLSTLYLQVNSWSSLVTGVLAMRLAIR